jgi:predicted TIM-barrel fold metal-dependent hydrolase
LKNHLAADASQMRRVYDMAADLGIPVLIHFQEVEHHQGEGDFNTGYRQFDRMLRAHRKTTFIGHADFFWANISGGEPSGIAYPEGKVKAGGLTDRWLADHPNLFGDLSANSGFNAVTRDPQFTRGFLSRHRTKLLFGCDCSGRDGKGTGGSPILPQLKGKCVARATLGALQNLADPQVFRAITWDNGIRLLRL